MLSQTLSRLTLAAATTLLAGLMLTSCGGDTDGSGGCTPGTLGCDSTIGSTQPIWDTTDPSQLPASSTVANICTATDEKHFIRAYLNEAYLWYDEIQAINPNFAASVEEYFYSLLVTTPDAYGQAKDRFSFIIPTKTADSLSTGANIGYGVQWMTDASGYTRVAMVNPGSPAEAAGMARGGVLISIASSNNSSWYPNTSGATVTFNYRDVPGGPSRVVTLTAAAIQDDPVPTVSALDLGASGKVGYMLFTDHSSVAQDKLIDAIASLQAQGINDLVLDMRYNGGGYLYVAEALASMVAGPSADGKVFERLQFNDKRATDTADGTFPFSTQVLYSAGGKYSTGDTLPALSLPRLYVLTTDSTCSASESVINSLRGVDVNVVLIGSTTCGKPYGFTRRDNCGEALYPIEFQGFNNKGFGDYANGFAPSCTVGDDFEHALGDPAESMLSAALLHMSTGQCPATSSVAARDVARSAPAVTGLQLTGRPVIPGRVLLGH